MKRALLLVGLVSMAAILLWLRRPGADSGRAVEPVAPVDAAPAAPGTKAEPPPMDSLAPARVELAPERARESAEPAVTEGRAVMRGRCVDEEGRPLAGCRVTLHGWGGNSARVTAHRLEHGEITWEDPPEVVTGAEGRFELGFVPPPPFQFSLGIRREGRVQVSARWGELAPDVRLDFGDVVMRAGGHVRGIVVDGAGAPQAEVEVELERDPMGPVVRFDQRAEVQPRYRHSARAGADGRFELREPVELGTWRVGVDERELSSPVTVALTEARPDVELRVEVRRPEDVDAIEGLVFDERGAPLRGVTIRPDPDQQGSGQVCTTDRDGRFRLVRRGRSGAGPYQLQLTREGYESLLSQERYGWGARDLAFTLQRGLDVHVRVTERESGDPVLRYGVRLFPKLGSTSRLSSADFELRALGDHEDGLAVIEGVERGPYQLLVETADRAWVHPLFVELEVVAGTTFVPVQVESPTLRTLRVESDGAPMAGTTVELLRPWDGEQVELDTRTVEMSWLMGFSQWTALVVQGATTDERGEVRLAAHGGSAYALRLHGGDHEPLVLHDVRLDAVPDPWVVEVSAGATLVGRVTPLELIGQLRVQAGVEATGPVDEDDRDRLPGLLLSRGEYPNRQTHPGGLEKIAFDEDGGFVITGIPPGSWRLELVSSTGRGGGGYGTSPEPVAEVLDLRAGEVRELTLDLPHWLRGTLRGRVRLDGEPYTGPLTFTARLEPDASGHRRIINGSAEADAEGRYVALLRAASYRALARVQDAASGAWLALVADEAASVTSDAEHELDLHVRTGRLRLRFVREDGSPIEGLSVQLMLEGVDLAYLDTPPSDAEGRASMRTPAGLLRARTLPARLRDPEALQRFSMEHSDDPDAWGRVILDLGEVLAGAEPEPAEIELRVPDEAGY